MRFKMPIVMLIILFFCTSSSPLCAQDTTFSAGECVSRSGGGISGSYNSINANLRGLDGVPSCCPIYTEGSGSSFGVGGEHQILFGKQFSIGTRLGLGVVNGAMVTNEKKPIVQGTVEESLIIEHRIKHQFVDIVCSPFMEYRLGEKIPLHLGMTVRYSVLANYEQSERILAPSNVVFENNRKDRLKYEGTIPSLTQLRFDMNVGVGYVIPISTNGTWTLVPRTELSIPLNNAVRNGVWKTSSVGIGLALLFNNQPTEMHITPRPSPPPPLPSPPPPPKPEPKLIASVSLHESEDGPKVTKLKLQSKATQAAFPLLPYVFFDDSSAVLAARYQQLTPEEANAFSYRSLDNVPDLARYCHVLNIVGKRMREISKVTITVVGCNSNTGAELNNAELSKGRAQAVRDYLVNVWKIESERIKLEARNLPAQYSNPKSADGIEENRRAEIIPSSSDLSIPVFANDTSFSVSQPSFIAMPVVIADAGVREWSLHFEQGKRILWSKRGTGDLPRSLLISINDTTTPRFMNSAQLSLEVIDNDGRKVSAVDNISIPVEEDSSLLRKQFTLVLFDFNSADLTPLNKRVAGMVKTQLKQDSRIAITGFADRTGNLEYNKKLAIRRGETLARTLDAKNAVVSAYDGTLLINNDLPEGRYFCRTVRVVIEDKR
jgi:outer membrane protein OmpA-like peptidoglycan-associated protein